MLDTRRPFTRSDALAAGVPASLLRGSRFRKIFRGVYVDAAVMASTRERTEAALLIFPDSARASHTSAARIYEVPVPTIAQEHVSVGRAEERRHREGIVCHVSPGDSRLTRGVRVSTPEVMFVELAELLELVDLVVVGDNLVRTGRASRESLSEAARSARGVVGRLACSAAALIREGVDSPMETRLRLLLVLAGCPEPQVNATLRGGDGEVLRRYDLSWNTARLIVEYDGRHHIDGSHSGSGTSTGVMRSRTTDGGSSSSRRTGSTVTRQRRSPW
ncbi:hypothetical protein KLP28_06150 [Nocardioidaceae bacterium]|nr:hypothetical protein KLP28_06150 [Nocardioidaceae bacterium]